MAPWGLPGLTCVPETKTSTFVPGASPGPPKVGRISGILGSKTGSILVVSGDGRGHRMSMDTGPMPHPPIPSQWRQGASQGPQGTGELSQPSLFQRCPHNSISPRKKLRDPSPQGHRLTVPLKKAVTAGQPLQEFSRGRQRTLGLEAEVHHTWGRTGSAKPRGGGGRRRLLSATGRVRAGAS